MPENRPIALVTGAASGIGRALVGALVARGAHVVAADIDAAGLATLAAEHPGQVTAADLDVTDGPAFAALVQQTVDRHGRLDWLFNNAGIALVGEAQQMTPDQWRRLVDVNLMGTMHGIQAAYPDMIRQGRGHIVNTASALGLSPSPLFTAYSATKYAVIGLTQGLRAEAAAKGVRFSVVCPGIIRTAMFDAATLIDTTSAETLALYPVQARSADACARAILAGIDRNAGMIFFPGYVRFFWWISKLAPWLTAAIERRRLAQFRARTSAQTPAP